MRTKFVAGNWKMNLTKTSSVELARSIARNIPNNVDVGVAPPFVYLDAVGGALAGSKMMLGAQDVHCEAGGAYTGEICVPMLKDLGVRFCLSGHSERRHILKEPSDLVAQKTESIYAGGLIPIHCVGETLEQRDANHTLDVVRYQIGEISRKIDDPNRLVIAYEPVWAIGTGRNATDQQAQEVHAFIRQTLAKMWNSDFASRVRIQYGGSMKPENAKSLLSQPDVDGGLIGGASLKAESFLAIVTAAAQA
ncbi:MAG TPA: triose-phosphate isomerase [Tepidisphaeraceae bacterium]|jgi:triosephosphate isomerase|nr:triose-phosphate isomerase [Tepidisphaeraceae bacterium]HEV8607407.1 triose-phosphate isomerase [Tepidisphaeraceae bacterium]